MNDRTLDLLLQEREIKRLLDEHLEQTVKKVEAITGRFDERSKAILSEVDDAKKCIVDTKIAVATEIAIAKKDIGELAVQRTLSVFTEARNVVLGIGALALTILVTSGLIGFSTLKSGVTAFVDAKVREWMSVSTPNSPVKKTLETLRNSAVVDALSIKLDRQSYGRQTPLPRVELAEDEKTRLYQVMLDPDTSDSEFHDAARLIEASKGLFAGYDNDLPLGDVIKTVMGDSKYSERKRTIIFENLWRESALLGASLAALEKPGIPDLWARYAFKNAGLHLPKEAEPYAIKMLESQETVNQQVAAEFLATNAPLNSSLANWLDETRRKDPHYPLTAASLAAQIAIAGNALASASGTPVPASSPAAQSMAAALLYDAVENGVRLRFSGFGGEPEAILWAHTLKGSTQERQLERLQRYFENDALLTAVLSKCDNNVNTLANMISALEVVDGQYYIASIQLSLPPKGWLQVADGPRLTKDAVIGSVRLSSTSGQLTATWRSPNGEFVSERVLPGSFLSGAHYSYLADQPRIGQLDMHQYESEQF